jgi:PAS domain S-box-containing protein
MKLKASLEKIGLDAAHLYAMVPSAIFTVDREGRITSWNRRAAELTGFSLEEALGKHCSILGSESCSKRCGLFSPEVDKPMMNLECIIKSKQGKRLIVSKNVDLLTDGNGNIVGGIECFEDVTQRKEAEDALQSQADIVNFAGHPMYTVNEDLKYLFGNKSFLRHLQLSASEELVGKKYSDFHSREQTEAFALKVSEVFDSGKPLRYIYESHRYKNKRFLRTLSPHFNREGAVVSVSVSSKEIDPASLEEEGADVITICAYCKNIANDSGEWERAERYFSKRLNLQFSHGICPHCSEGVINQLNSLEHPAHSYKY